MEKKRIAIIDCSKHPSEKNCQVKITAPENQIEELIDMAAYHAVKCHGHNDSKEFREMLRNFIEYTDARYT